MKKNIIIFLIFLFFLTGCSDKNSNQNNVQNTIKENSLYNYDVTRTTTSTENTVEKVQLEPENHVETDLSSFSTTIYTPNDTARQNNIGLTCSKLNGTIVKVRRDFFFLRYSWKSNTTSRLPKS